MGYFLRQLHNVRLAREREIYLVFVTISQDKAKISTKKENCKFSTMCECPRITCFVVLGILILKNLQKA
jgi:hypothetical protein